MDLRQRLPPVLHNPGQGLRAHVHPGQNHILAGFSGPGGVFIITYADSLGVIASDAITDNGIRLSDLEPHLKERLRRLLPDYVCGINPLAAFSQDAETVEKTIEIGVDSEDVGCFIEVLQTEMLESYLKAF